ncbi:basic salivary proline-rich protein 1-like [Homarus americanus]|uniref:basic salivary proline-rich protein 1-like n=1 Tax=Homarus americanus TaxID=6706 RepID=UPI001C46763F|nr:basic salivary proline-rich protein 1-like [Homarus americanus]
MGVGAPKGSLRGPHTDGGVPGGPLGPCQKRWRPRDLSRGGGAHRGPTRGICHQGPIQGRWRPQGPSQGRWRPGYHRSRGTPREPSRGGGAATGPPMGNNAPMGPPRGNSTSSGPPRGGGAPRGPYRCCGPPVFSKGQRPWETPRGSGAPGSPRGSRVSQGPFQGVTSRAHLGDGTNREFLRKPPGAFPAAVVPSAAFQEQRRLQGTSQGRCPPIDGAQGPPRALLVHWHPRGYPMADGTPRSPSRGGGAPKASPGVVTPQGTSEGDGTPRGP